MTNPNWPQFPGVPNMTLDEKGRPSVLDLVPGKQEGTPLNQGLINPIIHSICDLRDDLSATQNDESAKLPLTGGTVTGTVNATYTITDKPGAAGTAVPNTYWVDHYYANKTSLANETARAKAAEEGMIRSPVSTNAVTRNVNSILAHDDGTLWAYDSYNKNWLDYLNSGQVTTAINNETARAQTAEAVKVPSVPVSDHDDRLDNLVWNHTDGHLAAQLPNNQWESFYPTEKTVQALVYSDADARPTTIRTLKKGWGGSPSLIVENDGFDDINVPTSHAIETALNTKLSLSGGTLTGNLAIAHDNPNPGATINLLEMRINGTDARAALYTLLDQNNNHEFRIDSVNPGDHLSTWRFLAANGSLLSPRGRSLLESGSSAGTRMKQCFQVNVANGGTITWPIPYISDDNITVTFTPRDLGSSHLTLCQPIVNSMPNKDNCVVAYARWNGSTLSGLSSPHLVFVTVEGYVS